MNDEKATGRLRRWLAGKPTRRASILTLLFAGFGGGEAKRSEMAANVRRAMRETDSRECRNCHSYAAMLTEEQDRFAGRKHEQGQKKGETCIDCHQGIARTLPDDWKTLWKAEFEDEG